MKPHCDRIVWQYSSATIQLYDEHIKSWYDIVLCRPSIIHQQSLFKWCGPIRNQKENILFLNGSKIFAVILLEEKLEMDLGFKGKPDLKTL